MIKKISFFGLLGVSILLGACCSQANKTTEKKEQPNVLFISVDDLNDWIGIMGDKGHVDAKTPNLDRLAARGVYFANAHANTSACTPSRLTVMTGISAVNTGCYTNYSGIQNEQLFDEAPLLSSYLAQHGYHTMACGKIEGHAFLEYEKDYPGKKVWDERLPRSFRMNQARFKDGGGYGGVDFYPFPKGGSAIKNFNADYKGHSLCAGPVDRNDIPGGKMPDELTAEWAIERLEREHDKPFMLGVGFVRPHVPYTAPKEYFDMYPIEDITIPEDPAGELDDIPLYGKAMAYGLFEPGDERMVRELGENYRKQLVQGYLASVSFMDAQLGRVLDALDNSKHADNTVIVLWSDHGQHLGEKRSWRKQDLWQESTNCPMLWVVPGLTKGGQICQQPAGLIDIFPTLVEVLNLPGVDKQDGISLMPQLKNAEEKRDIPVITTWSYGSHAIKDVRWHYIRYYDGSEELYDGLNDPGEHTNLAGDAKYAEVINRLKEYLPEEPFAPSEKNREFKTYNDRVKAWSKNPASMPLWLK